MASGRASASEDLTRDPTTRVMISLGLTYITQPGKAQVWLRRLSSKTVLPWIWICFFPGWHKERRNYIFFKASQSQWTNLWGAISGFNQSAEGQGWISTNFTCLSSTWPTFSLQDSGPKPLPLGQYNWFENRSKIAVMLSTYIIITLIIINIHIYIGIHV